MNFKYKVDMPICVRNHKEHKGVVTNIDEDGIWFKWTDSDAPDSDEHIIEDYPDVMPDTPEAHARLSSLAEETQKRVDKATSLLEEAFKEWEAAKDTYSGSVDDAFEMKHDGLVNLSKFEEILSNNGWSTSSLYC